MDHPPGELVRIRGFSRDPRPYHYPSYRPDIDGLRALAIILVVMFHAFPSVVTGGFIGVDIFFTISGFLISSIIFKGLRRDTFSFRGFYANRIRRIFPALVLLLGFSLVFGWFFLLPGEYAQLGKHIVGGAGYVENFVLRSEAGYFDTKSFLKPLMHLWSLGIEEQFYLTYPFLLWAAWRLRCNTLVVLTPLVLLSFGLNVWESHRNAASDFFLPQTRFWELWIGGVLAYVDIFRPEDRNRIMRRFTWMPNAASVVGTILIGFAVALVQEHSFPGWWAVLPVVGSSLIIVAGSAAWINRRVFANAIAVFFGLISYPLYLWHWTILSFARTIRGEELPVGARIAAVTLSIIFAWATFRFVESPIRFGRKSWVTTASLVLTSVIVLCAGFATHRHEGFAGRFKTLPDDFGWGQPEIPSTANCRKTVGVKTLGDCRNSGAGAPDVLLIGDSHAGALYRGLAPAYAQRSLTLMNLGEPGCLPFYDTETYDLGARQDRDCRPNMNRILDFATESPSVRTIIISARGPSYMTGRDIGDSADAIPEVVSWDKSPQNSSQAEVYAAAFRNTILRLSASGKKVVVFLDWPELGFDPKTCLPRPVPFFSHPRALCGVPLPEVNARNHDYREVVFEMKKEFSGLQVFDPFPALCDATACYAMRERHLLYRDNNHLFYRDNNHLSAAGSAYLAGKFLAEQSAPTP